MLNGESLRFCVGSEATAGVERAQGRRLTRADPQVSSAVLAKGQDEIARQAIGNGVVRKLALPIAAQAAAIRPDPNCPVAACEDTLGDVVHQAFSGRIDL